MYIPHHGKLAAGGHQHWYLAFGSYCAQHRCITCQALLSSHRINFGLLQMHYAFDPNAAQSCESSLFAHKVAISNLDYSVHAASLCGHLGLGQRRSATSFFELAELKWNLPIGTLSARRWTTRTKIISN